MAVIPLPPAARPPSPACSLCAESPDCLIQALAYRVIKQRFGDPGRLKLLRQIGIDFDWPSNAIWYTLGGSSMSNHQLRRVSMVRLLPMPDPDGDRLHSWKEIAAFLGCEPRTAQRYEALRGLPVHRIPGGGIPRVFAYTSELQDWLDNSSQVPSTAIPADPISPPSARRYVVAAASIGTALAALALIVVLGAPTVSLAPNPVRISTLPGAKLPPLLTDGKVVYFQEFDNSRLRMASATLAGGPSRPLSIPLMNADPGVLSADGTALLLRGVETSKDGDEPLYVQTLPNAPPKRLGDIRAYDSAWLPTRGGIIFSRLHSVYFASNDGSSVRKLFDVPGRAYWFRWTPDGRTMRFTVYDSKLATYSIWQTASLDSPPAPVSFGLEATPQQCCGSWSPDGATYFFQASVNGFFHVFAHSERFRFLRGPAVQLTQGATNYRSPVAIPSGDRLLTLAQTPKAEVVQFDTKLNRWLPIMDGVAAATMAFSPDGKSVAYTRLPDHSLWRCDLPNCSDAVQLIAAPARVTMPRWSPDSTRIACMVKNAGGKWRASIVSVNPASGWEPLPDTLAEADPGWSPQGDRVVFGVTPNPDSGADASLKLFDLHSRISSIVPGSIGLHSPAWSPDGQMLAAIRADTREITLHDFKQGTWTQPLPGVPAGYLHWTGDGRRLFFLASLAKGAQHVMVFDRSSGRFTKWADFSTLRRPSFSFGDWIGIGPGDTPLALRDLNTAEILSWKLLRD